MVGRDKERRRATRLIHPPGYASVDFSSLAVPTYRGSTTVFRSMADVERPTEDQYRYGIYGTPTARELAQRIAAIEGADRTTLAPSGLAAVSLALLSFCKAGGHLLLPASAYGPTRALADGLLKDLGVETEVYDPLTGGEIAALIRKNTQLIWCESPGSITMEFQDVAAICRAAKNCKVPVAIDNTYGAGVLFDAFAAGVDLSVQALTKYHGGHSDLLMGSVSTRGADAGRKVKQTADQLGLSVSPDDCSLVLRGLKTFDLRLRHLGDSASAVAEWLGRQECVTAVLHPAHADCPGHEHWKRDWSGSASLFSIIFGSWTRDQVIRFVEGLELFKIGYSWGGANSLVMTYRNLRRPTPETGPLLVRLNVGLEDPHDLIEDLGQAMAAATSR